MHFPEAITATIVGRAIGDSQVKSQTREALAIFGDHASYQPPQSHPYLNRVKLDKSAARSAWGLPLEAFIAVCPFALDRLDPESMPWLFQFLRRVPAGCVVFVERTKGMASQVRSWIDAEQDIKSRFLFRPAARDTREFQTLLDASDVSLDSFSGCVAMTTAADALNRDVPHFSTNHPDGLMQGRVASELSIAAGLEEVCVGKTHQETMEKLVKYAQHPEMPTLVPEFLATNRREKKGFWSDDRVPRAWMSALTFYSTARSVEQADSDTLPRLPDYQIPDFGEATPVFSVAALSARLQGPLAEAGDELDPILRRLEGTAVVEMNHELRAMLQGIQIAAGLQFLGVAGGGSYVNTIRCRQSRTGRLVALDVSKGSRPADRMHNDPVIRAVANNMSWHARTRNTEVRELLPELLYLLDGGTSCCGTSRPNAGNKVISFLLREFIQGKTFAELISEHKKRWQEEGVLTDKLRIEVWNPLSQGVFWLGHYGLAIMDLKFDNVMVRTDGPHRGKIAFIDTGHGHTFARTKPQAGGPEPDSQPALLTRRSTSVSMVCSALERKVGVEAVKLLPKRNLFLLGRLKSSDLFRCITRTQMQTFRIRATRQGLANLSAGTQGPMQKVIEENVARRKFFRSEKRLQLFERERAFAADLLAANKMILGMLTLRTGESIADWDARAQAASDLGADGITRMLMASLEGGVAVQQPLAFRRVVSFLSCFLGPGERPGSQNAMLHVMNTLPILPAEDERELSSTGRIMLPAGSVTEPGCAPTRCPAVSFVVEPGKGIGVRAEEDIQPGTKLGAYAGVLVPNSEIGRPYVSLTHPSRFVAVVQGNIPALNRAGVSKLSVDAQLTEVRDWRWAKINRNIGPFFNAPDDNEEVNCVLDRASLWVDRDGLHSMWMESTKFIAKGSSVLWRYDPRAGPSGFWKFS